MLTKCSAHCICFYAYELYQLNLIDLLQITSVVVFKNYFQRCTRFCSTSFLKMWNITLSAASSQKFWVCVEKEDKVVLVANPGFKISSQPFFNDSHPSQPFRCRYATILRVAWLHWNGCQEDYFNDWLWKIKIKRKPHFCKAMSFYFC